MQGVQCPHKRQSIMRQGKGPLMICHHRYQSDLPLAWHDHANQKKALRSNISFQQSEFVSLIWIRGLTYGYGLMHPIMPCMVVVMPRTPCSSPCCRLGYFCDGPLSFMTPARQGLGSDVLVGHMLLTHDTYFCISCTCMVG